MGHNGLPQGMSAEFDPPTISLNSPNEVMSKLSITIGSAAPLETYYLMVSGNASNTIGMANRIDIEVTANKDIAGACARKLLIEAQIVSYSLKLF
jgi:hypothetical protein